MLKILHVIILFILLSVGGGGCQPTGPSNADPDALPSASTLPAGIDQVHVDGSCQATLTATLMLGALPVPIVAAIDTKASIDGETKGQVSLDLGGLVSALCLISPDVPEGRCAVGGLVPRMVSP